MLILGWVIQGIIFFLPQQASAAPTALRKLQMPRLRLPQELYGPLFLILRSSLKFVSLCWLSEESLYYPLTMNCPTHELHVANKPIVCLPCSGFAIWSWLPMQKYFWMPNLIIRFIFLSLQQYNKKLTACFLAGILSSACHSTAKSVFFSQKQSIMVKDTQAAMMFLQFSPTVVCS